MALIVENGSNVPNANTYVDLADTKAYFTDRGITIPGDATLTQYIYRGMDYIESFASRYQGTITYPTQALQWPRAEIQYSDFYTGVVASDVGIVINCIRIDNDVIPKELINLQNQVVIAISKGVDFANYNQDQKFTIEEQVGPLKQKYSDVYGSDGGTVVVNSINKMFDILFYPCGGSSYLNTIRV